MIPSHFPHSGTARWASLSIPVSIGLFTFMASGCPRESLEFARVAQSR
jgi:hypothetical protein